MTSIVIEGPIADDQHRQPDGSPWPMAMTINKAATVFGDSAGALLAHLIPGYADLPDTQAGHDEALISRWTSAVATSTDVQSLICADRLHEGTFDPAAETEESLTALLGDKTVPVEEIGEWSNPHVPLVLIATDYAPFTDRAPVTGNVLWLDPSDEVRYLHSLANLGVVDFYHNEDASERDDEPAEDDVTA